jgi:hypothetical protein
MVLVNVWFEAFMAALGNAIFPGDHFSIFVVFQPLKTHLSEQICCVLLTLFDKVPGPFNG